MSLIRTCTGWLRGLFGSPAQAWVEPSNMVTRVALAGPVRLPWFGIGPDPLRIEPILDFDYEPVVAIEDQSPLPDAPAVEDQEPGPRRRLLPFPRRAA